LELRNLGNFNFLHLTSKKRKKSIKLEFTIFCINCEKNANYVTNERNWNFQFFAKVAKLAKIAKIAKKTQKTKKIG